MTYISTIDAPPKVTLTRHADTRLRQRGFKPSDISLIVEYGEEMPDGTVMVPDRNIQLMIVQMQQQIRRLERLRGAKAVVAGGRIVTVYKGEKSSRRVRPRALSFKD